MKVLVLCSGGDAPGMNRFIWELYKKFKHQLYFSFAGFTGLINGQLFAIDEVIDKKKRNEAGTVTKSSRCPQFKDGELFNKGLGFAKEFDVVVILGGNGSERGAKRLFENGINTIFVPGTIDNDVKDSCYSIGFSTAVKECVYAVKNTMPSIDAFTHACLFEVMGRENESICLEVAKQVNADYAVCDKKSLNFKEMKNVILQRFIKSESACIIVRENIMPLSKIVDKLNDELGVGMVKGQIVGRTQRGGKPTKQELDMAKKFAKKTISCIKTEKFGVRILVDENMNIYLKDMN